MSEAEPDQNSLPKCDTCNIVFAQRKNLFRHNRSFHEERKFDIKVMTKSEQSASHEIDTNLADDSNADSYEMVKVSNEGFALPDDVDAVESIEWDEESSETETHYCTACNINISSVAEHVAKFHAHQTIYYETEAVVEDEEESTEILAEVAPTAADQSEDLELVYYDEEYLEESEPENTTMDSESCAAKNANPPPTNYKNTNILREKLTKLHTKMVLPASTPATRSPSKFNKSTASNIRLPKIIGTLGKTNEVDPVSGVKYVRKVMKIEKFWEDESFQLPPIRCNDNEGRSRRVRRTKRAISTKNVLKVTSDNAQVKSGHEMLVTSPRSVQPRIIIKREDVSGEEMAESSLAEEDAELDPDKEAREAIIKILQDDSSEEMSIVYVCQKCNAEFDNMDSVKTHKCKLKKSQVNLTCRVCGLKCKSQRRLQSHENTHDPFYKEKLHMKRLEKKISSNPITCSICHTQFTTEVGHRMHMKMHRPDNIQRVAEMNNKIEFRCDLCQMTCYSERTLRIHYRVHFPNNEPTMEEIRSRMTFTQTNENLLACKLCMLTFEDNAALKEHWQTHIASDSIVEEGVSTGDVATEETVISITLDNEISQEEYFTCSDCGNILSESYREMHEKMHRGELHYVCTTCNRKFPCQEHLDMHIRIHEPKVDLMCGQCSMKFTDQALLAAHISKHSAIERPYPCGFCGKCFSRPHEKVKHERVHTGEQPYECNICGMRFRVAYCLRMHERIHTGVRPYGCEYCDKTFRTRSGYKQHVSIHSDLREHHCKFCPKSFKTIVQLAGHRKSHTKPYVCSDCNRRFATSYMLRSHMVNHADDHTSNLKYKCPDCGASYGREYALRDHLKSTHGKVMAYPHKRKAAVRAAEVEASSNDSSQGGETVYLAME